MAEWNMSVDTYKPEVSRDYLPDGSMLETKKYDGQIYQQSIFVDKNKNGIFETNEVVSIKYFTSDGTIEDKDVDRDGFCDQVIITDLNGKQKVRNIEVDLQRYPNNEDNNLMSLKYEGKGPMYHRGRALNEDGSFKFK